MGVNLKKYRLGMLVFFLAFILSLGGCQSGESAGEKQAAQTVEDSGTDAGNGENKEQEEADGTGEDDVSEAAGEEKGEIPQELLPAGPISEDGKTLDGAAAENGAGVSGENTGTGSVASSVTSGKSASSNQTVDASGGSSKSTSGKQDSTVSGSGQTNSAGASDKKDTIQVTISAECKNAAKKGYTGPTTLLGAKKLTLKKGSTVYDALAASGVAFSGGGGYISGIGGVYEFDWGEKSGWLYSVNGTFPGAGCNQYVCSDKDVIKWRYTTDMGNDL